MKKTLFIAIACVFALASCTKFEHDSEFQAVSTGAPVISHTDSTQTSLSAYITPADKNTTYYSFAVVPGGAYDIDPAALLSCDIKEAIISRSYTQAEMDTIKLTLTELDPGETYTLYAVACSKTGTLSPVSKHMFILDDQAVPAFNLKSISATVLPDSSVVISIPFNRNIKLGENAKVAAKTWGVLDKTKLQEVSIQGETYYLNQNPLEYFEISGQNLFIVENVLNARVPKDNYEDGKYVSFTFAAGTVISLPVSEGAPAGKPCAAYNAEYLLYEEGPYIGIFFRYEPSTFNITASKNNPVMVDPAIWQQTEFKFAGNGDIASPESNIGTIEYTLEKPECTTTRKAAIDNQVYSVEEDTISVSLPLAPVRDEKICIEIEEGTVFDIFGNSNVAYKSSDIPVGKVTLTFEESMGCNLFECTVTPGIGLKFICDYYEGAASDSTDAALIDNMKAYIQKWADNDGVSFAEEYETYFANVDAGSIFSGVNLESEKTFTLYGFYMESDGTVVSDVFRKEVKTAKFEWPSETTGTFTYATSPFKAMGAQPGTPISINAAKDTITISNFGTNGVDLKCAIDKSGNIKVALTPVMKHATYGLVYANEIEDWYWTYYEEEWGSRSYYNSLDKTIYFNIVYHISSGGYFGVGQYVDTFLFDNSQPAAAPAAAKKYKSADCNLCSSKVAFPAPARRHVRK